MKLISPYSAHEKALFEAKPSLAFDNTKDFEAQRDVLREKFLELLGDMPQKAQLNVRIEFEREHNGFSEKRIIFDAERDVQAVCHLWVPKTGKEKYPLVVCLQGHSTGMHISMGRPVFKDDKGKIKNGDRDFAVQAIKEGYAALILEQRGFGERRTARASGDGPRCHITAMTALLLGRTMVGERVWDVSRALDVVSQFDNIDMNKVACMGNSGGGTTTFYAACYDSRIKIAMPSCSICTYKDSIATIGHCVCNFIPSSAKYFDMSDLAALIAPRKIIVVAGKLDGIFPESGVKEAYDNICNIYKAAGCEDNCRIVWGNEGHRFYADPSWKVFRSLTNW